MFLPLILVDGNYSTEVLVSRAGSVVTNFMAQRLLSTVDLGACIEYNTDYTGHNIRDGAVPQVDNFKDCQNLCFLRPDCNFWSVSDKIFTIHLSFNLGPGIRPHSLQTPSSAR